MNVDLLGDTDRNGHLDQNDEAGKDQWTQTRGILIPPHEPLSSFSNSIVGMSQILLRKPLGSVEISGLFLRFHALTSDTKLLLGLATSEGDHLSFDSNNYYTFTALPTTDTTFYVCSTRVRNEMSESTHPTKLPFAVELVQNGAVIASNTVLLTIAPIILPSECNPPEVIYSTIDFNIPGVTPVLCTGAAPWTQDMVKFTKVQTSDTNANLFVDLGHRDVNGFNETLKTTYGTPRIEWPVSGNGGNIMATPPLPDAPYGKVLVGSHCAETAPEWVGQVIQPVVTVDTSWLYVGHIDESLMWASSNTVLYADPWKAADLLHSEIAAGNWMNKLWCSGGVNAGNNDTNSTIIDVVIAKETGSPNTYKFYYLPQDMDNSSTNFTLTFSNYVAFVQGDVLRVDNEILRVASMNDNNCTVLRAQAGRLPAAHTNRSYVYAYTDLLKENLPINGQDCPVTYIQGITNQLQQALGTYLPLYKAVPVLFDHRSLSEPGFLAVTANIANCLVGFNGKIYYSQPGCQVFNNYMATNLPNATPIDVWQLLHCQCGEIHCGTASQRQLSGAPWWDQVLNWR